MRHIPVGHGPELLVCVQRFVADPHRIETFKAQVCYDRTAVFNTYDSVTTDIQGLAALRIYLRIRFSPLFSHRSTVRVNFPAVG